MSSSTHWTGPWYCLLCSPLTPIPGVLMSISVNIYYPVPHECMIKAFKTKPDPKKTLQLYKYGLEILISPTGGPIQTKSIYISPGRKHKGFKSSLEHKGLVDFNLLWLKWILWHQTVKKKNDPGILAVILSSPTCFTDEKTSWQNRKKSSSPVINTENNFDQT